MKTVYLFLTAMLLTVSLRAQDCIPDFSYLGSFEGNHYYISNYNVSPSTAYTIADGMGVYLASINSAAENAWLSALIPDYILIGLNDVDVEGTFVWHSGEPLTYTNWYPGEPNNSGNEDWVVTNFNPWVHGSGKWNDVPDWVNVRFVIEIEDADGDGVNDYCDNCKYTANPGQEDDDCDGVGNACDMCPGGDDTVDNNNDGLPDCYFYPGAQYLPSDWTCSNNSNNEKVRICHNGNTICVSENAIPAFIANGGYIGPCDNANCDEIVPFLNNGTTHLGMDGVTDFSFFPNPASGQVNIDLYNITTPGRLLVMDARGMIIVSRALDVQTTGRVELDAANWASGLYMISLHSGDISLTQRLVIQH